MPWNRRRQVPCRNKLGRHKLGRRASEIVVHLATDAQQFHEATRSSRWMIPQLTLMMDLNPNKHATTHIHKIDDCMRKKVCETTSNRLVVITTMSETKTTAMTPTGSNNMVHPSGSDSKPRRYPPPNIPPHLMSIDVDPWMHLRLPPYNMEPAWTLETPPAPPIVQAPHPTRTEIGDCKPISASLATNLPLVETCPRCGETPCPASDPRSLEMRVRLLALFDVRRPQVKRHQLLPTIHLLERHLANGHDPSQPITTDHVYVVSHDRIDCVRTLGFSPDHPHHFLVRSRMTTLPLPGPPPQFHLIRPAHLCCVVAAIPSDDSFDER